MWGVPQSDIILFTALQAEWRLTQTLLPLDAILDAQAGGGSANAHWSPLISFTGIVENIEEIDQHSFGGSVGGGGEGGRGGEGRQQGEESALHVIHVRAARDARGGGFTLNKCVCLFNSRKHVFRWEFVAAHTLPFTG